MRGSNNFVRACALATATLVALTACGGGSGTPPPTTPNPTPPGTSGATITIANGRVTPSAVTISVGQAVTFVNNDGRVRNVSSDPHPTHTDCPALNFIGNLSNGQTKATNQFGMARTCRFHDHDDPDNDLLKGSIVIQ